MSKILIITGGSKGIGKGIIDAYLTAGYQIFSIARSTNNELKSVNQISFDLSKTDEINDLLTSIFHQLKASDIEKITLINNAGTLGKIGRIEAIDDIAQTVALNTTAPLLLTSTFIKLTKNWPALKQIINISSGAAHNPYYGWTVYCATKAAIDMMTKTIALEQQAVPNGVKILAVYPGVVDTQMQAKIRESDKASFPSIDRFLDLKSTNSLANATTVGKQIYDIDHDDAIENGSILRVKE